MGAASVSGTGLGSVDGLNKGSAQMSIAAGKIIGPHVVAAGKVTLSSNVATIQFPVPTSSASDYIVIATSVNATTANAVAVTAWTVNAADNDATLSLKGAGATDVVNYAVIKTGLA